MATPPVVGAPARRSLQEGARRCARVAERKRPQPQAKAAARRRWDRRQAAIAIIAILVVASMVLSAFAVILYGGT